MTWICAYVSPRSETRAVDEIKQLGFDAYSPMRTVRVIRQRRITEEKRPLFVGYIFAQLGDNLEGLYAVRAIDGVSQIIGGYCPAIVKPGLIQELRHAERMGAFDERPKPEPVFAPGQHVRITAGPFTGFIASVIKAEPKRRVHVLLAMLGGSVSASVERGALVAV